jgi:hypothetical protein
MMEDGPRIANLLLEGIWDENVRTEETAALLGVLISGRAVGLPNSVEQVELDVSALGQARWVPWDFWFCNARRNICRMRRTCISRWT